ncbi:MAG: hypothetical protein NTZ10_06110 [Candidatus Saganbacteria bacterium]|nr:hypothetical protein [Candidatus Saganbacteria bacterium]
MKKLILIGFLITILSGASNALTMTLSDNTLDFGTMTLGEWKEISAGGGFHNRLSVVSDNGNVWRVYIKADQELINTTMPTVTIPNSAFKWMSTYAGNQNANNENFSAGLYHQAGDGYVPFTLVNELVYTSGVKTVFDPADPSKTTYVVNDNNNLPFGTEIQFKYGIGMPDNQTAGTYTTTVTITVTQ